MKFIVSTTFDHTAPVLTGNTVCFQLERCSGSIVGWKGSLGLPPRRSHNFDLGFCMAVFDLKL